MIWVHWLFRSQQATVQIMCSSFQYRAISSLERACFVLYFAREQWIYLVSLLNKYYFVILMYMSKKKMSFLFIEICRIFHRMDHLLYYTLTQTQDLPLIFPSIYGTLLPEVRFDSLCPP
jgi:hypothetical protein